MTQVMLNKDGRVTTPSELRRSLGLKTGDKISVVAFGNTIVIQKLARKERVKNSGRKT
jgi:AbrB family looped-hinge helix DNA binding protein